MEPDRLQLEDNKPLQLDNGLWYRRPNLQLKVGGQAQLDNARFASDQSEAGWTGGKTFSGDGPGLHAFYIYGSYTLTGETRPDNESRGTFGRIQPTRGFATDTAARALSLSQCVILTST